MLSAANLSVNKLATVKHTIARATTEAAGTAQTSDLS
jgi:hypothetical protein